MLYPEKPAITDLSILPAIKRRWSPRAFSEKPVEDATITILFEAARWAPSSFNEQPWRYVYCAKEDGADRARLDSLLLEGNNWAADAPLLILSFAKKTFSHNGKENYHAMHDVGCASGYLVLQATELGLIAHQMAGFDRTKANMLFNVPEDFMPGSMIAVGYPGDPSQLPKDLLVREQKPRERRPAVNFAFRKAWGEK